MCILFFGLLSVVPNILFFLCFVLLFFNDMIPKRPETRFGKLMVRGWNQLKMAVENRTKKPGKGKRHKMF